jgi:hypothetical protein
MHGFPRPADGIHGLHDWWYRCRRRAGVVGEGVTSGERMHKARHTAASGCLTRPGTSDVAVPASPAPPHRSCSPRRRGGGGIEPAQDFRRDHAVSGERMLVHALVYEQECSDVVGDVVWLARRARVDASRRRRATADATRPPTRRRSSSAARRAPDRPRPPRRRWRSRSGRAGSPRIAARAEPEAFRTSLQAFVLNQLADVLH